LGFQSGFPTLRELRHAGGNLSAYSILRFLHILFAIVFVGGVFSRQLVRSIALRSDDPRDIAADIRLVDPIERYMVMPGSLLVILFGVALALTSGRPILCFLEGSSQNWLLVANALVVTTFILVPTVFLPKGKIFTHNLEEAIEAGRMTPQLQVSLDDGVVRLAHTIELVAVVLVVVLMVFRPF
jgi:uncharacterized membrane protein